MSMPPRTPPGTLSAPLRFAGSLPTGDPARRCGIPATDRRYVCATPEAIEVGEALGELDALHKAATGGDGFADGFPAASLAGLLRARLALPSLSKADWVAIGAVGRT